jgi:hypothetical protein
MSSKPSPSFVQAMPGMGGAARAGTRAARNVDAPSLGFDEAMRLMESGHWQDAFEHMARLADNGHPQAARLALLFVRRGTALFGGAYLATTEQREAWQAASDWD